MVRTNSEVQVGASTRAGRTATLVVARDLSIVADEPPKSYWLTQRLDGEDLAATLWQGMVYRLPVTTTCRPSEHGGA